METYKLIRSERRTLAMELSPEGDLILRAPGRMPLRLIEQFIASHEKWIAKHREKLRRRAEFDEAHFSSEVQIQSLITRAKAILPEKTEYWAKIMGVTPAGVRITRAKKRFGSCSPENRIAYSYRLMAYPEEAIDYVVVHELSHIRHKNHSPDFYAFIARFLPDHKAREAILKHK
ncbi:MAG: M48 family metallopeptidase [Clostridia bacterium]|nr:M48 family metallopeptidase [Clostridia bacterium]